MERLGKVMLDAAFCETSKAPCEQTTLCSSSGSSSQDRAKLIEYETEGLIMLRVQFKYNKMVPLLLVIVVGIGKYTSTMSHRMCMTQYSISKRMSKTISQQQVQT